MPKSLYQQVLHSLMKNQQPPPSSLTSRKSLTCTSDSVKKENGTGGAEILFPNETSKAIGLTKVCLPCSSSTQFQIKSPSKESVWVRGNAAVIEWEVSEEKQKAPFVRIELLEEGSSAVTVITKQTANSGSFVYSKVPWGMMVGSGYFVKVSLFEQPSKFVVSETFFIAAPRRTM